MKHINIKAISRAVLIAIFILFVACGSSTQEQPTATDSKPEAVNVSDVKILHAGSLAIPFKEVSGAFMKKFPQYKVLLEGNGSRTCARQITDLKRRVDVMASADSAVIRNLLMPDYADYCIDFTTNEMAVMYRKESKFADTITSENWYEIMLKPGVQYGHSDPNADPCGYRALLTWQLAEKHYKVAGLYKSLSDKMPKKNIRAKETGLLAMLEVGELDYVFIYRSVAEQHQSKYVLLPDEVNLKSSVLAEQYKTAVLKITGKKPGEWIEKKGAPMVYGITLPKNSENKAGGIEFLSFLLGPEGQAIMKKNGQPQILPPLVDNKEKLPKEILPFFQ